MSPRLLQLKVVLDTNVRKMPKAAVVENLTFTSVLSPREPPLSLATSYSNPKTQVDVPCNFQMK